MMRSPLRPSQNPHGTTTPAVGRCGGFTLIELMVVIAVVVALMALGIPAYDRITERNRIDTTAAVVHATATKIAAYGRNHQLISLSNASGAQQQMHPLWDANGDGVLDGYVSTGAGRPGDQYDPADPVAAAVVASGYPGYLRLVGAQLAPRNLSVDGHVLDAWGRPLRVRVAGAIDPVSGQRIQALALGTTGVLIYSVGSDGIDAAGGGDDISSREAAP